MNQQSHRVSLHAAFILHGRNFRESSRLLDVFTLDYGRITLVAKGARSARSKWQGVLEPFSPLIISWSGKGEVQTLTGAEAVNSAINLSGKQVMSAYYINELLQRLLTFHDPHPELFEIYQTTLACLTNEDEETVLRRFEKQMLTEIGYALSLDVEAVNENALIKDELYYYDLERGPINIQEHEVDGELVVLGQTLIDMSRIDTSRIDSPKFEAKSESFSSPRTKKEAKQLMRIILNHHLGEKPLKTRSLHWYKPL